MDISIIIPTYNEANFIAETIKEIQKCSNGHVQEILVVDGGSTDQTRERVAAKSAKLFQCPKKGRAAQMNFGAEQARGDVLFFLHADSHPPSHFDCSINQAILSGCDAGCFRLKFDASHYGLKFYSWFTRFDIDAFRFGDQGLFINRTAFLELQGFREDHLIMEDQEIVRRIKRSYSFVVLENSVTTSARKYRKHGVIKLQLIFLLIFILYHLGVDQQRLAALFEKFLY